ncbi:MAG: Hpt domain-containing protein [Deltaproteobacteria bacterium]|jgi:chemotaxis protein histidine kinase CheA|nr:Hpt domain-containing protein [Deltaproteobacteria bacterium]
MVSDLLEEFIFDARDHLATAQTQLLDLEREPDSLDNLNALLGTLHTVKGNSGFVSLKNLYGVLHSAENLLQSVRDTARSCPSNIVNQLFQVLDSVEAILRRLEDGEDDEVEWLPSLIEAINEAESSLNEPSALEGLEEPLVSQEIEPLGASPALDSQTKPIDNSALQGSGLQNALVSPEIEPYTVINLNDGEIQRLSALESISQQGAGSLDLKGLILNLSQLTSFTAQEMRSLKKISLALGPKLALVLNSDYKRDFQRLLTIWELEPSPPLFEDSEGALSALKQN